MKQTRCDIPDCMLPARLTWRGRALCIAHYRHIKKTRGRIKQGYDLNGIALEITADKLIKELR